MARLELKKIVHERDEKGELLPVEVELELLRKHEWIEGENGKKVKKLLENGPTVLIRPLTRGELKALTSEAIRNRKEGQEVLETTADQDGELIKKCLVDPNVPEEQIKDLKPDYSTAITTAIIAVSVNQAQENIQQAGKAAIQKYAGELEAGLKKK